MGCWVSVQDDKVEALADDLGAARNNSTKRAAVAKTHL
jgi:hypothetical protein